MTSSAPSWDFYRTFLEVARDGSLSGAARRLGLTQPTAGRHIDALERSLGTKLFTRSHRGLTPTQIALEMVPHAERMTSAQDALQRAASGEARQDRGTVRLTTSEVVGCEVIPGILSPFCARHPEIVVELAVSNRAQDLLRRDADIAIRMMRPKQEALIARRIGSVRIGLFAHRNYVRARGLPSSIDDAAGHRLIGYDRDEVSFSSLKGSPRPSREQFQYRSDSDPAQIAALRAGIGIGGCMLGIAARDPDLIPVLPRDVMFKLEVWLAMHESSKAVHRIRLLFDHLAEGLARFIRQDAAL
ncbi:MAG: LysR family transcriptional regulator [Xanthobacteraceae bacterium]|nr:LysR family transcriptional regulator [Xanthobacteraceae bacterium]